MVNNWKNQKIHQTQDHPQRHSPPWRRPNRHQILRRNLDQQSRWKTAWRCACTCLSASYHQGCSRKRLWSVRGWRRENGKRYFEKYCAGGKLCIYRKAHFVLSHLWLWWSQKDGGNFGWWTEERHDLDWLQVNFITKAKYDKDPAKPLINLYSKKDKGKKGQINTKNITNYKI